DEPDDLLVEAVQLRRVEVDALVGEEALAVDLQRVVVTGQRPREPLGRAAVDDVLAVDAALQRGALLERVEVDGLRVVEEHRRAATRNGGRAAPWRRRGPRRRGP